jgi:hypothetical protein
MAGCCVVLLALQNDTLFDVQNDTLLTPCFVG